MEELEVFVVVSEEVWRVGVADGLLEVGEEALADLGEVGALVGYFFVFVHGFGMLDYLLNQLTRQVLIFGRTNYFL